MITYSEGHCLKRNVRRREGQYVTKNSWNNYMKISRMNHPAVTLAFALFNTQG
jgi:hypothetical protein